MDQGKVTEQFWWPIFIAMAITAVATENFLNNVLKKIPPTNNIYIYIY